MLSKILLSALLPSLFLSAHCSLTNDSSLFCTVPVESSLVSCSLDECIVFPTTEILECSSVKTTYAEECIECYTSVAHCVQCPDILGNNLVLNSGFEEPAISGVLDILFGISGWELNLLDSLTVFKDDDIVYGQYIVALSPIKQEVSIGSARKYIVGFSTKASTHRELSL